MGCIISRRSNNSPAANPARGTHGGSVHRSQAKSRETHEYLQSRSASSNGSAGSSPPRNPAPGRNSGSANASRVPSFLGSPITFTEPILFSHQLTEEYPHLYSEEAKAELKDKISQQGSDFRTTSEEQREFKRAFLSHVKTNRLTTQYHKTAEAVYTDYADKINQIKSANPDIRHIPTEDLIALRAWTASTHYPIIMNALEGEELPDNPLGLSYTKSIISALNALPDRFIHEGSVYTGDNQPFDQVLGRHKEGGIHTDWSFFATANSKKNAWQNRSVEWETHSASGKYIAEFSIHAHESEVLFPPGTQYLTNKIEEKHSPRHFLKISQEQVV